MDTLPADVLRGVFLFLDVSNIANCERTCKSFRYASSDSLWLQLCSMIDPNAKLLPETNSWKGLYKILSNSETISFLTIKRLGNGRLMQNTFHRT
jgi:hypothetical protein